MIMNNNKKVIFQAFNRNFDTFEDAYNWCITCDLDAEYIKILEV